MSSRAESVWNQINIKSKLYGYSTVKRHHKPTHMRAHTTHVNQPLLACLPFVVPLAPLTATRCSATVISPPGPHQLESTAA